MNYSSTDLSSSSGNGPLRRNQACHQCRARKLKCDAGRPCTTCRRSHAKAVASLTAAGQSVLAEPNCTYDYAPGEDPWTATLRSGLGLTPPRPYNSSGSVSPANSAYDVHPSHSSGHSSSSGHARRSPHYPPSTQSSAYPYASASSTHPAYSSPSYPAAHLPGSHVHNLHLSAPPGHPYPPTLVDNLDYGEMADMLYNQMEMDPSDSLFTPRPSYTDPYFRAPPLEDSSLLYARDPMALPSGLPQFHSVSPLDLDADNQPPEMYGQGRGSSSRARSSRSRHH